ncbi:hypothetical protein B0J17DRAFT_158381 [Rhizoctonia solani]|nr:hypothetical protein B0J17DRAFT_158381 [Rhizoctonia solani]
MLIAFIYQVLSNCQRHVKLCQKRSVKVLNPREEESTNDPAASATPFIQFSNDSPNASQPAPAVEPATRRSHEIPIRPKIVSRGSGSTNSSAGGNNVVGIAQRQKSRSGSSSSVGSLVPKTEPPSMPASLERRGSGSTVPVVPSSPAYSQGSYSASYAYPQSNTYGTYGQGSYESSGSSFNSAYGGGYSASGSRYDQAAPGFEQANVAPGFEQASAAAYDSLNPSFTSSVGYENSVPAYGTSSPAFDRSESSFSQPHQYGTTVAGPPQVQPLPSPSHVQSTPHSTASPPTVSHEPGSYFPSVPGVYAAPSARRLSVTSSVPSRRSTIAHTLVQRDQLGFHDAGATDPSSAGPTSDAGSGPPTGSGSYYSPSSCLVGAPYQAQALKQEEATPDLAHQAWPKQQSYQTGYSEPQWAPATGAEASSFHAYNAGSTSSTDLAGPHDSHVASAPTGYAAYPQQQPQSRQQLYLQQAQGGYSNPPGQQQQQAQQHDAYGNGVYANHSTTYGMNSGVVSVPRHSHQDSSNYAWPGTESGWNTQSDYRS